LRLFSLQGFLAQQACTRQKIGSQEQAGFSVQKIDALMIAGKPRFKDTAVLIFSCVEIFSSNRHDGRTSKKNKFSFIAEKA
jgi:hypothetical protein